MAILGVFAVVRAAVAVQMGGAQRARAVFVKRLFPGIQLFRRQRVALACLLVGQHAVLYRLDNSDLSGFYPALCGWRGQEGNLRAKAMCVFRHERTRFFYNMKILWAESR